MIVKLEKIQPHVGVVAILETLCVKVFDIFFKKRFSVLHINVAFTLEEYLAGYTSLLFSSIGSTLLILKEQMSTQSYTVM